MPGASKIKTVKSNITRLDMRQGSNVATDRIRGRQLGTIRDRIALRDEYTCRQCGHITAHGEVDHIVPLHLGGRESDENRQWLCKRCHDVKSEREEKERNL